MVVKQISFVAQTQIQKHKEIFPLSNTETSKAFNVFLEIRK